MNREEQFPLSHVISPRLVSLNMSFSDKQEAIKKLTELLYANGNINDKQLFLRDVYLREEEGSTCIGQGVAIPHGKSEAVVKTAVAIGVAQNTIPWEGAEAEEQEVNIVILFAVQNADANTKHILMLQQIAILLADDAFITGLHNVESREEVIELVQSFKSGTH
ncbi:PTS system, fructose-specific IIA component [Evansella caseinilytica]|uniref:PTS system, fructose-specific IIA component n=1 Tax=Evansella caseinilytica TaxID=1503961 RepID=A0A1H3ST57_9BACI|nr:PTS sugar transporter subunit IIA [Evansella caseinilytica]SDZ41283.1 PTS system, fructose-specific IIA component [Evansella caseinilytica]